MKNKTFNWSGFKWKTGQPWGNIHPDKPIQWYNPEAALVAGNKLKLYTSKNPNSFFMDEDYVMSSISIGLVHSVKSFKYGTFQISARLPEGQNLWPAFWLTAVNDWPPEIDIMEAYSKPNGSYFDFNLKSPLSYWNIESNVHYKDSNNVSKSIGPRNGFTGFTNPLDKDIIFTLIWTPSSISIYYGENLVRYTDNPEIMKNINNNEFYVILNNGVQDNINLDKSCRSVFTINYFKYVPL